jgi:hypothetical protein
MHNATPARIVLVILGMTATAAFITAGGALRAALDTHAFSRSRPELRRGPQPVAAAALEARAPLPSAVPCNAESQGAAEKMFPAGLNKDFGAVSRGTQLLHHFPVVNVHAVPIAIAYLQPSCGCVTATAPRRALRPGQSTTIDVRMDTRDFTGSNTQNVRVKVAGPDLVSTCKLVVSTVSQVDTAHGTDAAKPRDLASTPILLQHKTGVPH